MRSGSYGIERKNLINNLFKNIIDLSFPNIVKYLFWACEQQTGIFEKLNQEDYDRYKKMSKYKQSEYMMSNKEVGFKTDFQKDDGSSQHSMSENIEYESINQLLDINILQNEKLREEQILIQGIKKDL